MENFLIVIIFIASVIYKVYSNYKKETEKAKKRNPQQRPSIPPTGLEDKQVFTPYTASTPIEKKPKIDSNQIENDLPLEVKKIIDYKKQAIMGEQANSTEIESPKDQQYSFDLRQAILQSAILERPYK